MTRKQVEAVKHAARRVKIALIAEADRLDDPFPDRPETSPWKLTIAPALRTLNEALADIEPVDGEQVTEYRLLYREEDGRWVPPVPKPYQWLDERPSDDFLAERGLRIEQRTVFYGKPVRLPDPEGDES